MFVYKRGTCPALMSRYSRSLWVVAFGGMLRAVFGVMILTKAALKAIEFQDSPRTFNG